MYSVRVEDLKDRVGYVISDGCFDVIATDTRAEADRALALLNSGTPIEQLRVAEARAFALRMHGDQDHGCRKIAEHLEFVAGKVADECGYPEGSRDYATIVSAAWCHDILEDTAATLNEVTNIVGAYGADLVMAVTDAPGKNRYERHLNTYWRIRTCGSDAVLIKLCDRWHNHFRSLAYNERYMAMYLEEYPYFKMALWRPNEHVRMWELLDNQYERMNEQEL